MTSDLSKNENGGTMTSDLSATSISTQAVEQGAGRKVSEILADARKLIEKPENWRQSNPVDEYDNRLCVEEAIERITPRPGARMEARELLSNAVGITYRPYIWNDTSSTTHPKVLAAFDKAIEAARADELARCQSTDEQRGTEGRS